MFESDTSQANKVLHVTIPTWIVLEQPNRQYRSFLYNVWRDVLEITNARLSCWLFHILQANVHEMFCHLFVWTT